MIQPGRCMDSSICTSICTHFICISIAWHRVSAGIMGHVIVSGSYVISTVTCYALTTELWLPVTFVITLLVKVVPAAGHFMA